MICPVTGTRCESTGCTVYIDGRCAMLPTTPARADSAETPETDLNAHRVEDDSDLYAGYGIEEVVDADFARSLERRLATVQGELEEARRAAATQRIALEDWHCEADGCAVPDKIDERATRFRNDHHALKDALRASHADGGGAGGWIPVGERLPEDSRFVLAFVTNSHGKGRRIRALYAAKFTVEQGGESDWIEYSEEKDEYFLPAGWYEANEYEETHWHVDDPVTHWMPLPAPPPPREGGGK